MVAHATDVPSAILEDIHVICLALLRGALCATGHRLIFQPQISYLWEQTLLGTHWKLFVIHEGIVSNLVLVLDSRRLYTLIVCSVCSIIACDVTFLSAYIHAHLLLLLHPTLCGHTVIVLLVTLQTIVTLDGALVHRNLVPVRILTVAEILPPIRVRYKLLLLSLL